MTSRPKTRLLIVFALSFFLFAETVSAVSAVAAQTLQSATVNLYCRIRLGGETFSMTGSGVFIDGSGVILTNAHVGQFFLFGTSTKRVKARCSVRDGSPARERYSASLLYLSPRWASTTIVAMDSEQSRQGTGEHDFALLRVVLEEKGALPISFPALPLELGDLASQDGARVTVAGYPSEGLNFKGVQRDLAFITASPRVTAVQSYGRQQPDILMLSPSAVSASGISGGPVMNASGELLGIAVAVKESAASKGERSLRSITLSHIDRALREEIGLSLRDILNPNLGGIDPSASPYAELRATVERSLRNAR